MDSLTALSIGEIAHGLNQGLFSAVEVAQAHLSSIEEKDHIIGAYLTLTREKALEKARVVDEKRARGDLLLPLEGVPCALKDNFSTRGVRTTCASKLLDGYVPPYDATAWERLDARGCVLLGKTNMDEFAMGSSGEHSAYYLTRNPRDVSLVPGGSSSGSAAAVAAQEAVFALGSDTGGSVRLPASYCGVVGLRPTYGAISRYGLIAFASSLDTVGIVARNIEDTALVYDVLRGADERDQTSRDGDACDLMKNLHQGVCGMKIAVLRGDGDALTGDVLHAYGQTIHTLETLGAVIVEKCLPEIDHALNAYCVLTAAEAMSNLMLYDGVRLGCAGAGEGLGEMYTSSRRFFGEEVRRRLLLGTYALSAGQEEMYYQRAVHTRRRVTRAMNECLTDIDAILSPVYGGRIKKLSEVVDPVSMYQSDRFLVPAALANLPALALPNGMQFTARAFGEGTILRIGRALEREAKA